MNPMDFILLFISLAVAVLALAAQGWGWNGVGPAVLSAAGGAWQLWMQWLRHRSWLRHRASGFSPGTQPLALSAAVGWLVGTTGAMLWVVITHNGR